MALPTTPDARDYLRLDSTGEDNVLDTLVAQATGAVASYVSVPLTTRPETFVVEGKGCRRVIGVPVVAIDVSQSVTVVDGNGATVSSSTYRVDARAGLLYAMPGYSFACFPYTVTLTWGLGARTDYADTVERVLSAAILDVVADRYQRRNPAATSESSGGGVATAYGPHGIPMRVCELLDPLMRLPR